MKTSGTVVRRAWCAALLAGTVGATSLQAQASPTQNATAQITARVYSALTIVKNEDLRFGNLFAPYASKTIAFTDDAASGGRARLTLSGEGGAELNLVVNVPSSIASGANTLPVGTFVLRRHTTDANTGGTDVSLVTGDNTITTPLSGTAGGAGSLFLRVIATATPGGSQATGAYSGTISVTVNYTGA
jgi:Mat/Ecp fimbriae major subunit